MVWTLRLWGMVSALILSLMLLPSIHNWGMLPAEAARTMRYNSDWIAPLSLRQEQLLLKRTSREIPAFREAPAFNNGHQCLGLNQTASRADLAATDAVCDSTAVHIAMTLDVAYLRGSLAAILSILQHAGCPENVVFHFLVSDKDQQLLLVLRSTFPSLRFKIYHFQEDLVKSRISASVRQALEQPLNYARNYLADILEPCVQRVIYLDSDLVVVDDIASLWGTSLGDNALGAPEYCHANFTKYFTPAFWADQSLANTFDGRTPCYFNTGVMVIDLAKWRRESYTKLIELWMDIQKEKRIYDLGSLPPFLLVFAGSVEPIEHRWNQHGLGGDNLEGRCRPLHPGPVSLLHWSGKGKPWMRLDAKRPCPVDSLWAPYDLLLNEEAYH